MIKNAFKASFIKRIISLTILFNIIFVILFVGMTFIITKSNISGDVNSVMVNSSESASDAVSEYISNMSDCLRILAGSSDTAKLLSSPETADSRAVFEDMDKLMSFYGKPVAIWCVSEMNGGYFADGGKSGILFPEDYEWFSNAEKLSSDNPLIYVINDSYKRFVECDSQIVLVMPVRLDGEFVGCAGIELSSEALSENISRRIYTDGVYSAVLDQSNNILCSPGNDKKISELLGNTEDGLSGLAAGISANGTIIEFKSGKTTSYAMCQVSCGGLRVLTLFDGRVADGSFTRMYSQQIIILACLFVLELIATLNVIRHEAKDIPEISNSIAEISAGNYNFRINSSSENEIGLIAKSVDDLAQTLQDKNAVIEDYMTLDPTTGLQNRYKLYEYIEDLMVSRDESRKRFALLFIDIDNFKWITETLGHRHGDEFLKIFGQRLKAVVPRVFRFSGDEFVILADLNDDFGIIDELIRNLRSEFIEPIEILNDKLYVQFSVGISIYPDDDTNPDMLLRDADIAMSRAKEKGKGRTSYYNASLHQTVLSKATIAQKLNKALENNEMFLNFQPIISVQNGDIHGFEVLVRWESEELGSVPPFTFVQIAEETGAIVEIGTWIFETGCRFLKRMNEINPDIIMSINVSPVQLKRKDFLDKVRRTINVFQVNPANIQIEITETSLVEFIDGNNDTIQKLADMGIALALDDFGTGYSSFGYLKDMPIKTLKVDKSFVDEICSKHKDYQITGSIIDMVKNLGIKTVVEGVESIEQYNILAEMKCDYIQGFLMSKPLNASDAMEFVETYEELHKPSRRSLEENSQKLAVERLEREKHQAEQA
ncbi:MAG: EAL domain-containing protein [Oscillospiraceae bacterium]|nr:EAL domain-containing protein [Oscillospiraceae bacterium]MDY6207712.1 EAL domain-containing protein [Oscillospiraceae bacterium]